MFFDLLFDRTTGLDQLHFNNVSMGGSPIASFHSSATNNPVYVHRANFNYEIESCLHICTILITSLLFEFRKVNDILKSNPEEKK